jgi:hypothetical protein
LYSQQHGQHFGYDGKKLLTVMIVLIVAFTAFMILIGSNWYLRVTEDSLDWQWCLSLTEKRYSFDQIDKIVETSQGRDSHGNVVERRRTFIVFANGEKWSYEDMAYPPGIGDPDQNLFSYIQDRSGKPLIHATFIEDVAP